MKTGIVWRSRGLHKTDGSRRGHPQTSLEVGEGVVEENEWNNGRKVSVRIFFFGGCCMFVRKVLYLEKTHLPCRNNHSAYRSGKRFLVNWRYRVNNNFAGRHKLTNLYLFAWGQTAVLWRWPYDTVGTEQRQWEEKLSSWVTGKMAVKKAHGEESTKDGGCDKERPWVGWVGKERMRERMKCIGLVAVLGGSQKMQIDTE